MLYQKTLHFLIILLVPLFVFVVPVFDIIMFIYINFVIKNYYARNTVAKDMGYFLMLLTNLIYFYYIVFMAQWFIYPKVHKCGPIMDGSSGFSPIELYLESNENHFLGIIYSFITFYPIIWVLLGINILRCKIRQNKSKVFKEFTQFKQEEFKQTVKQQLREIELLKQKLEFQRIMQIN